MSVASEALSGVHKSELLLFFTLLQLCVIVLAGRIGANLALRWGQSAAVGEIIIGIVLGPTLFGWLWPDAFNFVFRSTPGDAMQILSQIGLILLMFQIGMEFEFSHLAEKEHRRSVTRIAVASMVVPFGFGYALGYWMTPILTPQANPTAAALFVGTAFSITALPILGRMLIEFDIARKPLGVIAISAAAINDVVGWLLLALVTMLAVSGFDAAQFGSTLAPLVLYVAVCWWGVRPLLRWCVRHLGGGEDWSNNLLGVILVLVFLSAIVTYKLGIFAIFGGFMLGVLLHDQPQFVEAWRRHIGQFVNVFFLPIFFTYTGLRTDIGGLDSLGLWGWCAIVVLAACIGKYLPSYLAARSAGMSHGESQIVGVMMNTRALMELIVINIGYDLGVISKNVFTMLVIMAIVSTVITTPVLRHYLPKLGYRQVKTHVPEEVTAD